MAQGDIIRKLTLAEVVRTSPAVHSKSTLAAALRAAADKKEA